MDVIILTIIISLLFIVFAFGPIFFQEYNIVKGESPEINFNQFSNKYFLDGKDLAKMDLEEMKSLFQEISTTIAEMERNAVNLKNEAMKESEKIQKQN
jgi:hypothetical protein